MDPQRETRPNDTSPEAQFVSFEIGDSMFLIPIERVVEFRIWSEPAPVPRTPDYVRGIVNIRGEIVPIYDVAARLGRGATEAPPGTSWLSCVARTHARSDCWWIP